MSNIDLKRRAQQLAAVSLKIKHLSKESKLDQINQIISESQKYIPSASVTDVSAHMPVNILRDSQQTITSIGSKSPRRKQEQLPVREMRVNEEVISLQEYNVKLEEQLRVCKEEREKYREKWETAERHLEEIVSTDRKLRDELELLKQTERKPFFDINDVLGVYTSRLPIPADKVDSVAFSQAKVTLKEQVVYIREKDIKKEFVLDHIARVLYYDNIMCIQVAGSGLVKDHYLFKFNTQKMKKKWDRALYMNRKLSLCIDRQRLFESEFPEDEIKKRYRDSVISEKAEEYEPSHNDIPQNTPADPFMKIEEGDDYSSKGNSMLADSPPTSNAKAADNQTEPLPEPVHIRYAESYIVPLQPSSTLTSPEQIFTHTQSTNNPLMNLQTSISTINEVSEFSDRTISIPQPIKGITTPSSYLLKSPKPDAPRASEMQRKTSIENLKRGYVMTKYAKWGLNPHQKFVYLKPDALELHWQDIKSKTDKKIPLDSILGFQQKYGQGMSSKAKTLDVQQCVVIEAKGRVLQFSCDSKQKMLQFLHDVDVLLRPSTSKQ